MLQCIMIAGSLMMIDTYNNEAISIDARKLTLVNSGVFEDVWVLRATEYNYHTEFSVPAEFGEKGIVAVLQECERQAKENG